MSYQDYQLKEATRRFIAYQRFTEPTMIQQAVIPSHAKEKTSSGYRRRVQGRPMLF